MCREAKVAGMSGVVELWRVVLGYGTGELEGVGWKVPLGLLECTRWCRAIGRSLLSRIYRSCTTGFGE